MKKSIIITLISCLVFYTKSFGQDALSMNDFNYNSVGYNSSFMAAATSEFNASFTSSLGNGIQNTSKVNALAFANIEKYNFGVGLKLNSKFFGLFKTNTAELLYAKELKIDNDHKLFLGFNVGMHFSSLDMNKLTDQVNFDDPFLLDNEFPQYRLTTGIGVGYTFKNKIKAGLSIPVLVKNNNDFSPVYIANTSYRFEATQTLSLTPEILAYGSDIEPFSMEGNLKVDYKDYAWFKIGGRSTKSIMIGMGWHHKFINIGYIHNMYFGEYSNINQAVHNVNVTFEFGTKTKKEVYGSSKRRSKKQNKEDKETDQLKIQIEAEDKAVEEELVRQKELKKEAKKLALEQAELEKAAAVELARQQVQLEKEAAELARQEQFKQETKELVRQQYQLEKEKDEAAEQIKNIGLREVVEELVKETLHYGTYQITEETSLRIKATSSSTVLKRLSVGRKVLLLEKTTRYWWMVDYNGKIGYVKALLLKKQ